MAEINIPYRGEYVTAIILTENQTHYHCRIEDYKVNVWIKKSSL